jgi:hypothetical protein
MPEATRRAVLGTAAGLSAVPLLAGTARAASMTPDEDQILQQMADAFGE